MRTPTVVMAMILVAGNSAAAQAADHAEHHHQSIAEHLGDDTGASFDSHFLMMMIHHHRSGIDMARLASKRAHHKELKQLAESMAADQEREVQEMTAMLKAAGKGPGEGHAEFREKAKEDLQRLTSADEAAFDLLFLRTMSIHHGEAIAAGELALKSGGEQVKAMAQKAVEKQRSESAKMMAWQKAWHGESAAAGK